MFYCPSTTFWLCKHQVRNASVLCHSHFSLQMEDTVIFKTTTPHPVLDRAFNSQRQHSTIWYNFPCCRAQSAQQWQTVVEGEGKEDSSFSRKQRYTVPRMVVAPDFITFQFQQKETSSRIKMTFTQKRARLFHLLPRRLSSADEGTSFGFCFSDVGET